MRQFEIRVRFTSDADPQEITLLAEEMEDLAMDSQANTFIHSVAGPVDSHDDWADTAMDNMNELID